MILYPKDLSQVDKEDLFEYLHYVEQLKGDADIQGQTCRLEDAFKGQKKLEYLNMLLYGLVAGTQYKYGISLKSLSLLLSKTRLFKSVFVVAESSGL